MKINTITESLNTKLYEYTNIPERPLNPPEPPDTYEVMDSVSSDGTATVEVVEKDGLLEIASIDIPYNYMDYTFSYDLDYDNYIIANEEDIEEEMFSWFEGNVDDYFPGVGDYQVEFEVTVSYELEVPEKPGYEVSCKYDTEFNILKIDKIMYEENTTAGSLHESVHEKVSEETAERLSKEIQKMFYEALLEGVWVVNLTTHIEGKEVQINLNMKYS